MSTKPTGDKAMTNLWASAGTIVVPATAKIIAGWKTGERPPSQYKNFWGNRVDTWLRYLSDASFTGGVTADALAVTSTLTVPALAAAADDRPLYIDSSGVVKKGHASRAYSFTFLGAMVGSIDAAAGAAIAGGSTVGSVVVTAVNPGSSNISVSKGIDSLPKGFRITAVRLRVNTSASANGYNFFASNPSNTQLVSDSTAGDHTVTLTLSTPLVIGDNTTTAVTVSTAHLNDVLIGFDVIGDES